MRSIGKVGLAIFVGMLTLGLGRAFAEEATSEGAAHAQPAENHAAGAPASHAADAAPAAELTAPAIPREERVVETRTEPARSGERAAVTFRVLPKAQQVDVPALMRIAQSLRGLDGVHEVKINQAQRTVRVSFDAERVSVDRCVAAIGARGYTAETSAVAKR